MTAVLVCTSVTATEYAVVHALDAHRAVEIDNRPGTSTRLDQARRAEDRKAGQ